MDEDDAACTGTAQEVGVLCLIGPVSAWGLCRARLGRPFGHLYSKYLKFREQLRIKILLKNYALIYLPTPRCHKVNSIRRGMYTKSGDIQYAIFLKLE